MDFSAFLQYYLNFLQRACTAYQCWHCSPLRSQCKYNIKWKLSYFIFFFSQILFYFHTQFRRLFFIPAPREHLSKCCTIYKRRRNMKIMCVLFGHSTLRNQSTLNSKQPSQNPGLGVHYSLAEHHHIPTKNHHTSTTHQSGTSKSLLISFKQN